MGWLVLLLSSRLDLKCLVALTNVMMKRRDLMQKLARVAKERGQDLAIWEGGNHTLVTIGPDHSPAAQ